MVTYHNIKKCYYYFCYCCKISNQILIKIVGDINFMFIPFIYQTTISMYSCTFEEKSNISIERT